MRDNTRAIESDPRFSIQDFGTKGKWGVLRFSSPRAFHEASVRYARTANERWAWGNAQWAGLGQQTLGDFDTSGIPQHGLALARAANAALPIRRNKPGQVRPSICGGAWNIPAVEAGIPLCARMRHRTKLAPRTITLVETYSASVNQETLSPIFAKLARAINDYTLAGGAVTLRICVIGFAKSKSNGTVGLINEVRVPCNDLAQVCLGLSVTAFRALGGPLCTAYSESRGDCITIPRADENPIPNSIYLGGRTTSGDVSGSIAAVVKALEIS